MGSGANSLGSEHLVSGCSLLGLERGLKRSSEVEVEVIRLLKSPRAVKRKVAAAKGGCRTFRLTAWAWATRTPTSYASPGL